MLVRRALFAATLGSSLTAASPADAAPGGGDGWLGWLSRTIAEALVAVGGGPEPDLGSGGDLLLERGISTVSSGFRRSAPALGRLDVDLGLDANTRPNYGLAVTQPLVRRHGQAFDLTSRVGYQPDGTTLQAVALSYQSDAPPGAGRLAPTGVMVELERTGHGVADHARHAVVGQVAWTSLEFGGGLQADRPPNGRAVRAEAQIAAAHAHLSATLPGLPWAGIETRGRWSTSAADPARLVVSEATYLVRACPFGPLELTAGRRTDAVPEPDWFTRLQLRGALGGGA